MVNEYPEGSPIMRSWIDNAAPTGEGEHMDCQDGTTWQRVIATPGELPTGVQLGRIVNGRIVPI